MLTWQPYTVQLKNVWRIAHGATTERHNVLVQIGEGMGEAAGVPHHHESQEGIIAYLESIGPRDWDPFHMEDLLNSLPVGSAAARDAIDIALHDRLGKRLGQPLYRILGLDPARAPLTSYTISIDTAEVMAERARECGLPVLKIKMGGEEDEKALKAIRAARPDARIRVDANAGWGREQAAALIPRLIQYDIEFVEQPLAIGDVEGLRWLHSLKLGVPIFADENILTSRDVAAHLGAVDGVVIKLQKTGGIREALRAIHTARSLDMKIMLGSMVETTLGVTAAAHIAPLCDYADLDGPFLIANDPFTGVSYDGARMILPETSGLGVQYKN